MGFQKNHNYFSPEPFEHYDTLSGNVLLTFTDLTLPGNAGRSLQFQRTYNNQRTLDYDKPSRWSFGFPGMVMHIWERPSTSLVGVDFDDDIYLLTSSAPSFVTADGAVQPTVFSMRPDTTNDQTVADTTRMVISGNFYKYDRQLQLLYMPDGTVCHYELEYTDSQGRPVLSLDWFDDQFGNRVSLARNETTLTVTQDLRNNQSRPVVLTLQDRRVTSMTYEGRVWQYQYNEYNEIDVVTLPSPDGPGGPTGLGWTFSYEATNPGAPLDLKQITTPNGGRIEYTWVDVLVEPVPGDPSENFWRHFLQHRDSYDRDETHLGQWTLTWGNQFDDPISFGASIQLPSGATVGFGHGSLTSTPGLLFTGGFGIAQRLLLNEVGQLVESESLTFIAVPVVRYSSTVWWGTPEPSQRTITRGSRTYTTQYEYDTGVTFEWLFPWNRHQPTRIIENNNEGLGRTTTRTYEDRPTGTTDGASATTSVPYILGLPKTETVTVSTETFSRQWLYDTNGFMIQEGTFGVGGGGVITAYAPDSMGNIARAWYSVPDTSYSYSWGVPNEIQTAAYTISREINPDGTVSSETRGSRTTTYAYDAWMRQRLMQPPGGTNPTVATYDINGASVTVSRGASFLRTSLDGFGRPVDTLNSQGIKTTTLYDAEGRITYRSLPFSGTADVGTKVEYDALDRVTREIVHDREHDADGAYRQRTYGPDTVTIRDEEDRETLHRYVAFGHPDDARLTQLTDAKQQTWTYAYNAVGKLKSVTAPDGVVRTWQYNDKNLLWRETHPESGTTTYTYINAGLPLQKTDAKGNVTTFYYDANLRLSSWRVNTQTTTVQYEPGSDQRQSITTPNGSTTFLYDAAGRLQQRRDVIGAYVFFSQYVHDADDNLVQITYPTQRRIRFDVNSEHQVTRVYEPEVLREYATGLTYHPSGALAAYTAGNGIQTTLTYDPLRYWVRSITAGTVQFNYDNYDGVGNVRTITDSRPGGMTQQVTYDELDRISTVVNPIGNAAYVYDVHGNRASVNGATYTYQPGTLRLLERSGVTYAYDADGSTERIGANTFTYTGENWLASATVAGGTRTYTYDSEGWRIRKTAPGDNTFYLRGAGQEVLTEWQYTSSGSRARDYVYAGGRLITSIDRLVPLPTDCGGEERPDGTPQPITISTAGGSASVTFEGSGCRRASVLVMKTGGNIGCFTIDVRQASNNAVVGGPFTSCGSTGFVEPFILPVGGNYLVTVDASTGSGTANVQIYDVVDAELPIAPDGLPVPIDLLHPGENARLPFTGTAGQRVSVLVNVISGGFGCWAVEIWSVASNTRVSPAYSTCATAGPGFLEPFALPADGDYRVVVNPNLQNTGSAAVHLYEVEDVTTGITATGAANQIDLTVPGRNARLRFSGVQNQRASALVTVSTGSFGCWAIEIWSVATNTRVSPAYSTCAGTGPGFLEPFALPSTGDYDLVVNPNMSNTGIGIASLFTVIDVEGSISPNSGVQPLDLLVPGQAARLSFTGTASYKATIAFTTTSGNLGCWWLRLLRPDGTTLQQWSQCSDDVTRGPVTLDSDGAHAIVIDPGMHNTGTANISLSLLP
jgi:YD repeat-containing protein